MKRKFFNYKFGKLPLPVFFPDATRAVVKSLDTRDIESTGTKGVLVNTFHLWNEFSAENLTKFGGIGPLMDFKGAIISDSGGFQVMSVIKSSATPGKITDQGVIYYPSKKKKVILTPEKSIEFQMNLKTDMVVCLDDFTDPKSNYEEAKKSVERTIHWAVRCKNEYLKLSKNHKPYLLGVVQGGKFQDLRKYCAQELVKIGFDGLGYGGWPVEKNGKFDIDSARTIAESTPGDYFLYGLGVGKPEDIAACVKLGFNIFDCVLPTRDARHGRLYVYNFDSLTKINLKHDKFYSFYRPESEKYKDDLNPVSKACDCLLCKNYSRAYLCHLFKIGDFTAGRLATIHNLRFFSVLMQRLRDG